MKTFLQAFVDGDACCNEIDDYVNRWYKEPGTKSLDQFLGFSKDAYKDWVEDPDDIYEILNYAREKARQDGIISPRCCKEMIKNNTVIMSIKEYDDYTKFEPEWKTICVDRKYSDKHHTSYMSRLAKFCPHCAKPLPNIVKKDNPPKRVRRITDGGYYCNTCDDRLISCMCLSPIYCWEINEES